MSGRSKEMLRLRWGDVLAAVLLCAAAAALWAGLFSGAAAETAVVLRDGQVLTRLELGGLGTAQYSPVEGVVIEYGQGRAAFLESGCPDQVCVRTGELSRPGQSAVCLPQRIVLQIEGEAEVDAISG